MSMQTPFAIDIPEETRRLVEPLLAAAVCIGWWAARLTRSLAMRISWTWLLAKGVRR